MSQTASLILRLMIMVRNGMVGTRIIGKVMQMKCPTCNSSEMLEGTLEGVSFEPKSQNRVRVFRSGVYSIEAQVCAKCGTVVTMRLDCDALKRIVGQAKEP